MTVLRVLLALATAALVTLATIAFSVQDTLTQPAAFVSSMDAALASPEVAAEVRAEVRQEVLDTLDRVASDGPVAAVIAGIGKDAIADAAAGATDTDVFRTAWHDWSLLLFGGLSDRARAVSNDQVSVGRTQVTVAVAPLIAPVLGNSIAGGFAQALDLFDANSTVTLDVGFPIGPVLSAAGRLAEWRWWLLAAAAGAALLLVTGRRGWRWLAIGAVTSGIGCALAGTAVQLAQSRPPPGAEFPQLGLALTNALTQQWDATLFRVAVLCTAVAVVAFLLDAVTSRRRRSTVAARAEPSG